MSRFGWTVLLVVLCIAVAMVADRCGGRECGCTGVHPYNEGAAVEMGRDTVYMFDTVRVAEPTVVAERKITKDSRAVFALAKRKSDEREYRMLDSAQGGSLLYDSVEVVQREYGDSTYRAWVSGPIDPRLDSIEVYRKRETVTIEKIRTLTPKRWHIGVSVGYGVGRNGFQPYIGVGITYSIFSF